MACGRDVRITETVRTAAPRAADLPVVPHAFASARGTLTWRTVRRGLERQLFATDVVEGFASECAARHDDPPAALTTLAAGTDEGSRERLVGALARLEPERGADEIESDLLRLALAWAYERRSDHDDPLAIVETIYADFDYPESIEPFVRYMPSDAPDLGSAEANTARLFERWRAYVVDEEERV